MLYHRNAEPKTAANYASNEHFSLWFGTYMCRMKYCSTSLNRTVQLSLDSQLNENWAQDVVNVSGSCGRFAITLRAQFAHPTPTFSSRTGSS